MTWSSVPPVITKFDDWEPDKIIRCLCAKVIDQEETDGKYGPGIHNHIIDIDGNIRILTTWRRHMKDLKIGKTYHLYNVKVENFTPPDSWYDRNPDVSHSFWMSLPYHEPAYHDGYAREHTSPNRKYNRAEESRIRYRNYRRRRR